jgi:Tol biopolymer transport system component
VTNRRGAAVLAVFATATAFGLAFVTTTAVAAPSTDSAGARRNDRAIVIDTDVRRATISGNGRYAALLVDVSHSGGTPHLQVFVRDLRRGSTRRVPLDEVHYELSTTALSDDGRFIGLTAPGPGLFHRAVVYDFHRHVLLDLSRSPCGAAADGESGPPSLSGRGRFGVFISRASNLVAGDTNGLADVFIRDLRTGRTRRVSVSSTGEQANGESWTAAVSADGRYVVFDSEASNLVPGDTNRVSDVFVRDLWTGRTRRVSVTSSGQQANGPSSQGGISDAGDVVTFTSGATNLFFLDSNREPDVFVHDSRTGRTRLLNQSNGGEHGNGLAYAPIISGSARYAAFVSYASNLVRGDTNHAADTFVRDLWAGTIRRVSVSSAGQQADRFSLPEGISTDGRYVAFLSGAGNLTPGDTNNIWDLFIRDTRSNTTTRISLDTT